MNFFIYLGVFVSKSNSALHGVGKSKKHINKVDQVGIRSLSLQWDEKENTPETAKQLLHPGKLTFWTQQWRFGHWFSFSRLGDF